MSRKVKQEKTFKRLKWKWAASFNDIKLSKMFSCFSISLILVNIHDKQKQEQIQTFY